MPQPTRPLARTYRGTTRNLAFLASRLKEGEMVAVPTETVYGLAANALNPLACAKIFRAKGRPRIDPLIVHIHSLKELPLLCKPSDTALRLAKRFWPGPLTIVLPKTEIVPDIVTAGRDSVAVRMPSHPIFRRLLAQTGLPLAAPSANRFGYVSPTTAAHVRDGLGDRISYILEGGPSSIGLESTIVDLRDPNRPQLLRPGAITASELEKVLGCRVTRGGKIAHPTLAQLAPGMMSRHYSPRTPVFLHRYLDGCATVKEAYILIRRPAKKTAANVFWLDEKGSLQGAAQSLFAVLRRVDKLGFSKINVEMAGGGGLAEAINDRLRRAANW